MDKGIPRDFPWPASSRNLAVSGVMPKASVTGTKEIAEAFYSEVLPLQGWHIYRRIKIQGSAFSLVACKVSQCVTLNAFHQAVSAGASDESDELDKSDESDHRPGHTPPGLRVVVSLPRTTACGPQRPAREL